MSKTRTAISLIGVFSVLFAFLLVVRPQIYPGSPDIPEIFLNITIGVLLILLGFYAIKSFNLNFLDADELYLSPEIRPEDIEDPDDALVIQGSLERDELRQTVRKILEDKGIDETEKYIDQGLWTDNKIAKAFIEESINYPVIERLREWIEDSGTNERRESEAVNALEELYRSDDV